MSNIRATRLAGLLLSSLVLAACGSGLEQPPLPNLETQAESASTSAFISIGMDDLEEASSGAIIYGNPANQILDFSKDAQVVGLRFNALQVPQGATITNAFVELVPAETDAGSTTLTFKAQAADSAPAFAVATKNVSARATTAASASWSAPTWTKGEKVQSSDISRVVQEVVSRSGWASGNTLALIVTGDNQNARRAMSRNAGSAITLTVSYTVEGATEPTEPTEPTGSTQQVWLGRLRSSLDSGRYQTVNSKFELDPNYIAASGDSYLIGRFGNMLETAYVLAYRETGDRKLMDYVNKFMVTAQSGVGDHNGDGYRDILYKLEGTGSLYNTDIATMEEMLVHGTLASLTLALEQAGYSSTASWWASYLTNDFVPKWKSRGVLKHPLTHPNANYIRFHYAMYKLTGDGSYLSTAKSMAATLKRTIRNDGWSHFFGQSSGCQPMVYVPLTAIAMADLATNGSGLIDTATMQQAASVVATRMFKDSSGASLAADICGNGSKGGMGAIATFSFTPMAAWDGSGRIEAISERVYNATERYNLSTPVRTPLPAALTFVKGR